MNIPLELDGQWYSVHVSSNSDRSPGIQLIVGRGLPRSPGLPIALPTYSAPLSSEHVVDRLPGALRRALERDFLVRRKLERGGEVEIFIPVDQRQHFPKYPITSLEDALSYKPESGDLCRPMFLEKPDLSSLYGYQVEGVNWLLKGRGRLLADEMGLGKTVQCIAAARLLFWEGVLERCLIVCPKSLVLNWQVEFRRWAPELLVRSVRPYRKNSNKVWAYTRHNLHVTITNYEQLRSPVEELRKGKWGLVIADEAHRLRNEEAQISSGVRQIERDRVWALTGTPIERDPEDLANVLSIIEPRRFAPSDARVSGAALSVKAQPFMLRRLKQTVLPELPRLVENAEYLELSEAQRRSYKKAQHGIDSCGRRLDGALAEINEMRKICDYDPKTRSGAKLDRIVELLAEIKFNNEKAIVFSYLLEPLRILRGMLNTHNIVALAFDGGMGDEARAQTLMHFKEDESVTALLASSRVASEGLTLVEANHAIFVNQWWNPSANAQARDRINRIGQQRVVYSHTFICVDTVEEYLQEILREKGQTVAEYIDRIASVGGTFDSEEMRFIYTLRGHA